MRARSMKVAALGAVILGGGAAIVVAAGKWAPAAAVASTPTIAARVADMVLIPAGAVQIGEDAGPPDEVPATRYRSSAFYMDRSPVTVAQFRAFVASTGYRTDAEHFGSGGVLDERQGAWTAVQGADWRHPTGTAEAASQDDHPVVQVSWRDADAFCRAYGARLPTEFEWERAGRLGQTRDGHVFTIGDPVLRNGRYQANVWQGLFPLEDEGKDGYRSTSPVGAFGTAPSGLTDMAGNVWEWTASWWIPYGAPQREPQGGGERVSRGGSFLCSKDFCEGYRVTARNHATPDTSLENIGFRCVADQGRMTPEIGRAVSVMASLRMAAPRQTSQGGA